MVIAIEDALDRWTESDLEIVVIDGAGERAFCAGGDIAELYESGKRENFEFGRKFWADEYRLNAKIANYPLPYVAVIDGIAMGGGVGVSAHGSDRIVTERTIIAMPECGIGLIPDIGGSFILSRAPGHLGEYLAMTGYRMTPGDAVLAGFADIQIAAAEIPELIEKLEATADLAVLGEFAGPADPPALGEYLSEIDRHFGKASALECIKSLEAETSDWARETAAQIRRGCPLSIACAFRTVRDARNVETVEAALRHEYRFTFRSMSKGELIEGIRAQIIDKDRRPNWRIGTLEEVTEADIDAMLAPLGERELNFNGREAA